MARLLVVSQESTLLGPLVSMAEANSWQIESASSGWGAIERVEAGIKPDLLMLDAPLGDSDGLHFLRWMRRLRPQLPIILICEPDDTPKKQEAIRLGARDCLFRPLDDQEIERMIRRHLPPDRKHPTMDITSDDVEPMGGDVFFVGASVVMRKLRAQAAALAAGDFPVLIVGERGSGKRTAARLIHELSVRAGHEFASVNCAALPCDLLESELFGFERNGSGPATSKLGKLEFCEKGTLILDEITELPLPLQAKLLQVLQSKRFQRPGTGTSVQVNVRILAGSTTNVEPAVSDRRLREDLYYGLSAYTIHVPPLRERREEVPLLLHYFMRKVAKQYGLSARSFPPAVLEACQTHAWPGNLREMETFVKRYLMAGRKNGTTDSDTESGELEDKDLLPSPSATSSFSSLNQTGAGTSGAESLRSMLQNVRLEAERNAIAAALRTTGWNRKAAARLLKVSYRTLLYKIEQYQMKSAGSTAQQTGGEPRSNRG
jgi:two-component system, NtrC family, response regulator AtoC